MALAVATDENFSTLLKENPRVVAKFYADWCGSCRLMAPKFKKMAESPDNAGIVFLDVNAEQNPETRKAVGVNNLPFFATFRDGLLVWADYTAKAETVAEKVADLH